MKGAQGGDSSCDPTRKPAEPPETARAAIWRPKPGPVLRWSRLLHVAIGFVVPWIGFRIGGYAGLGWASVGVLAGGVVWELSTPLLERLHPGWGGWHPWADMYDLVGFVAGWLISVVVCLA